MATRDQDPHHRTPYFDLIYDLCISVFGDRQSADHALHEIAHRLEKLPHDASQRYEIFERAWIIRIAVDVLRRRRGRADTGKSLAELPQEERLEAIDSLMRRLSTDELLILLLRDKYGLPYPEIGSAMSVPEGSLQVLRSSALRAIEDWIWEPASEAMQ